MAFQLSGLFNSKNTGTVSTGAGSKNAASVSASANDSRGLQQLQGLKPGQTFSGEVIAKNGSEVQIRLEGDNVVTARLEKDINLALGQDMTFEVKSNTAAQLALRPVYDSPGFDANGVRALQAAALPVSQKTLSMVTALMEQGMGIDRKTLLSVYKDMMTNAGSNPEDVVALHKLKLPVNGENLQQVEGYRNLEHQIVNGIETVADQIKDTLLGMVKGAGGAEEAARLVQDMARIFLPEEGGAEIFNNQTDELAEGSRADARPEGTLGEAAAEAGGMSGKVIITEDGRIEKLTANHNMQDTAQRSSGIEEPAGMTAEVNGQEGQKGAEKAAGPAMDASLLTQDGNAEGLVKDQLFTGRGGEPLLTAAEINTFAGQLEDIGLSQETAARVRAGNITPEQLFREIAQALSGGSGRETLGALFSGKGMQHLLRLQIENNWLLSPEKAASKEELDKLYTRLREQSGKLEQALASSGRGNASLGKSLQNVRENVDFMQQLNQNFTYIQLPLKMMTQNAHGDLYVYTNKKNLAKKDGNVSALLHLDMDHLGAMDIYVSMQRERVSMKFYLQEEALLDFMEANMHILNDRLMKRGYTMSSEVVYKEQETNVVKEMMKQEGEANMLSMFSFDVRA